MGSCAMAQTLLARHCWECSREVFSAVQAVRRDMLCVVTAGLASCSLTNRQAAAGAPYLGMWHGHSWLTHHRWEGCRWQQRRLCGAEGSRDWHVG